jgi:ATP-binding cassette subfamily G (WHITE) protein 2 (PDR)
VKAFPKSPENPNPNLRLIFLISASQAPESMFESPSGIALPSLAMSRFEKAADCEAAAATPQSSKSRVSPLGAAFRSVGVYAIATPTDYQKTFGNFPLAVATRIAGLFGYGKRKCRIDILRECEGLVRSGEMLLVLGRPGSGCSTLMRTIAGETRGLNIDEDSFFNYQGGWPNFC